jgi:integrase
LLGTIRQPYLPALAEAPWKQGTLIPLRKTTRKLFEAVLSVRSSAEQLSHRWTGCGELLALQWADLDFDSGLLTVSKSLEQTKAGLRVKSTKSEDPRELGVPAWALEVLREHQAEQGRDRALFGADYVDSNLIFCQPDGQYYSPDRQGARVVEIMRAVGLQGVSLHSLRHSHASGDSGEAERSFRKEAERHSGMIPNTIGA